MVKCTICGAGKRLLSLGWKECKSCKVWYCPNCRGRLKTKGLVFKHPICVRCGREM
jgi:hypothetical protein